MVQLSTWTLIVQLIVTAEIVFKKKLTVEILACKSSVVTQVLGVWMDLRSLGKSSMDWEIKVLSNDQSGRPFVTLTVITD